MRVVEVAACYRRDSGACPSELSRFYLVVGVVVVGFGPAPRFSVWMDKGEICN